MSLLAVYLVAIGTIVNSLTSVGAAYLLTPAPPYVVIHNGTIQGSTQDEVDTFSGIPFAQPPIGSLRLKPPIPLSNPFGTLPFNPNPPGCPQFLYQTNTLPPDTSNLPPTVAATLAVGLEPYTIPGAEDCLTLDIQRPSATAANAKLPVMLYIHGGGFELGSSGITSAASNGTTIVQTAVNLGHPILYVAINYRLGGFGFLGGREVQSDQSSNLGLRDQRFALEWVQENIAAFGGDPDAVTLYGQSAGAWSIIDQLVINNGDHTFNGRPLFRAVIPVSGSVGPVEPIQAARAQKLFDQVVENTGCSADPNPLDCLRNVPYANFLAAVNNFPALFSFQSLNLPYLPRPDTSSSFFSSSPEIAIAAGRYARVPILHGSNEDEGTLFALFTTNLTSAAQLTAYLSSYFPPGTTDAVAALVDSYPADPAAGSPFRTGSLNNDFYPEFKRLAAILGDIYFTLTRRWSLQRMSSDGVDCWSFLLSLGYGTPYLGTTHGSDLPVTFGNENFAPGQPSLLEYMISFVVFGDPNRLFDEPSSRAQQQQQLLRIPKYSVLEPRLLTFNRGGNNYTTDDFRTGEYAVFSKLISVLKH